MIMKKEKKLSKYKGAKLKSMAQLNKSSSLIWCHFKKKLK